MPVLERSIIINASTEKVFAYLADPLNEIEMNPSILKIADITGNGLGQRWHLKYDVKGFILTGEAEVIEYVANARYVTKTTGDIISTWSYTLSPQKSGSRLDLKMDYELPVPILGIAGEILLSREIERAVDTEISNIKKKLEVKQT